MRNPNLETGAAFAIATVILGANFVAVRYSNDELAPFWGAALRFSTASLLLFALVFARGIPLPRGRALVGSVLFGILAFGATYALAYWSLLGAAPATVAVLFATMPLSTLFLALLHRLESFRPLGLLGGLLTLAGIGLIFRDQAQLAVPLAFLAAGLLGAICAAEAGVVVKLFPRAHPFANNAVAMAVGSMLLFALSLVAHEDRTVPTRAATWIAFAWLVLLGSMLAFVLLVFVLGRWRVSDVSYQGVLSPLVTAALGLWLRGDHLSWAFVAGGGLVLFGVWVGALWVPKQRPTPPAARPA